MPIGVTLIELRRDLRAETGQTLNVAMGVQSQQNQDNQLDRQQRELWEQYEWQHLKYATTANIVAGQQFLDYPVSMKFDAINRIFWSDGTSKWKKLDYGLNAFQLGPGLTARGTPSRWGNAVNVVDGKTDPLGRILLYPPPASDGILLFEGQAPCNPLVADSDTCILDSKAIVLFAASEILAVQKVEAAQLKLVKAQNYLRRLIANQGADKRPNYNMGGNHRTDTYGAGNVAAVGARPGIDYIP